MTRRVYLERQNVRRGCRSIVTPVCATLDGVERGLLHGIRVFLGLALGALAGCGQSSASTAPSDGGHHDGSPDSASDASATLSPAAGFIDIEPIHYLLDGASYVSDEGRLWYAFEPAASSPEKSPLFVFFNGGPGSSTTENLFAGNTATHTEDPQFTDGATIAASPRPWTALGNLLYVDARETGFSYDVIADSADAEARKDGYSNASFSAAFDGADFVRVVLRFLSARAPLLGNPVVVVGESYGGVRAAAMIHDLLHPGSLRLATSSYIDTALADESDQHFASVFPGLTGSASPSVAARQFGRQILIEPVVAGRAQFEAGGQLMNQPGSPLYVLGTEIGKPYVPCDCGTECGTSKDCQRNFVTDAGRDPHDINVTLAESAALAATIEASLSTPTVLSSALGVTATRIPQLEEAARAGAFRAVSLARLPWTPANERGLRSALGQPQAWDWYLLGDNPAVGATRMSTDLMLLDWGADFLADLPYVKTFITHAMLDVVVYPPSIPASLGTAYPSMVASVDVDTAPRAGVPRPGWFTVNYAVDASDGGTPIAPQTVRFPVYANAGHHVSSAEPVELEEDVAAWLAEP
jgi:Serine carboxypeptidase